MTIVSFQDTKMIKRNVGGIYIQMNKQLIRKMTPVYNIASQPIQKFCRSLLSK